MWLQMKFLWIVFSSQIEGIAGQMFSHFILEIISELWFKPTVVISHKLSLEHHKAAD